MSLAAEATAARARAGPAMREPWHLSDEPDSHFEDQLRLEVHPDHVLWGQSWALIARRQDQDDFAFLLADGKVATVHLTFSDSPEHGQWPGTHISSSVEQWLVEVVEPEIEEWRYDAP